MFFQNVIEKEQNVGKCNVWEEMYSEELQGNLLLVNRLYQVDVLKEYRLGSPYKDSEQF